MVGYTYTDCECARNWGPARTTRHSGDHNTSRNHYNRGERVSIKRDGMIGDIEKRGKTGQTREDGKGKEDREEGEGC